MSESTSSSLRLKFSMLNAYTVTSGIPISRHHCNVSANLSNLENPLLFMSAYHHLKYCSGCMVNDLPMGVAHKFVYIIFLGISPVSIHNKGNMFRQCATFNNLDT
jgi:hypothetical protein